MRLSLAVVDVECLTFVRQPPEPGTLVNVEWASQTHGQRRVGITNPNTPNRLGQLGGQLGAPNPDSNSDPNIDANANPNPLSTHSHTKKVVRDQIVWAAALHSRSIELGGFVYNQKTMELLKSGQCHTCDRQTIRGALEGAGYNSWNCFATAANTMIENKNVVTFEDILEKSKMFSLFAWGSALEALMFPNTTVHDLQHPLLFPDHTALFDGDEAHTAFNETKKYFNQLSTIRDKNIIRHVIHDTHFFKQVKKHLSDIKQKEQKEGGWAARQLQTIVTWETGLGFGESWWKMTLTPPFNSQPPTFHYHRGGLGVRSAEMKLKWEEWRMVHTEATNNATRDEIGW